MFADFSSGSAVHFFMSGVTNCGARMISARAKLSQWSLRLGIEPEAFAFAVISFPEIVARRPENIL